MNILLKMKRIKDLSPSERQVVSFILEGPARAVEMGIADLARESFTSTSTVMRVTRKLGLDGFSSFRHQLTSDLNEYLETTALFRPQEPIEPQDTLSDIVDKVTSNNVRAVLDVRSFNDLEIFQQVVDMMSAASQLDFYGSGVSNLICHDAMIKALRLGVPATAYSFYCEQAMLSRTSPKDHLAVVDPDSDMVLGIHMVGDDAAEIMQGFAVALKCGATKEQIDSTIGIHPSAAEELVTMRTKRD